MPSAYELASTVVYPLTTTNNLLKGRSEIITSTDLCIESGEKAHLIDGLIKNQDQRYPPRDDVGNKGA